MQLDLNLWYVRWFFWSCHARDRFLLLPSTRDVYSSAQKFRLSGTNLCQFVRMLFIGVAIVMLTVATYLYLLFVVLILPFILFRFMSIGATLLFALEVLLGITLTVTIIIGIAIGINRTVSYLHDRTTSQPERSPGFFRLMIAYFVAVKRRYCPMIVFDVKSEHE
jgi:hypothetical protein